MKLQHIITLVSCFGFSGALNAKPMDAIQGIVDARNVYSEVNSIQLENNKLNYKNSKDRADSFGSISKYTAAGKLRKVACKDGFEDGTERVAEFYYDKLGKPLFVYFKEVKTAWVGDTTTLKGREIRLYLDSKGGLLKALQKVYRLNEGETPVQAAARSQNETVSFNKMAIERLLSHRLRLGVEIRPRDAQDVCTAIIHSFELIDEADYPANKQLWMKAPYPEKKTYAQDKSDRSIIEGLIKEAKLPAIDSKSVATVATYQMEFSGDFSHSFLVTAHGHGDKRVESIRYRLDLRVTPDKKKNVSFFGYQVRKSDQVKLLPDSVRDHWKATQL